MERVPFSPARLRPIAGNTLREAVRQKALHALLLLAAMLIAGAHGFRDFHFGSPELKFVADLGLGVMALFGAVVAVAVTTQLFFSEFEHRTAQTLLARPVWRAEFILGKFLGAAVITGAFCGLLTGVLALVLWSREASLLREFPDAWASGRMINFGHLAAAGLLQWLKLLVLSALTLLVASYARTPLFTLVSGLVIFAICQLQHLAVVASAREGDSVGGLLAGVVVRMFPNFHYFDLGEGPGGGSPLTWSLIARVAGYAITYAVSSCALAVYSFRCREI